MCPPPRVCTRTHKTKSRTHVKDPVVILSELGGLRKHEKTQHALYNYLGLGVATLLQLALLGESRPEFPMGDFLFPLMGQQSVQTYSVMLYAYFRLLSVAG